MGKWILIQLLFLLIIGNYTEAQTAKLQQLDSFSGSFVKKVRSIDKEKAYLITDKSIYTAGEPVWFRSFLLHNISNKISIQSTVLFVDIVNENDHVLAKTILNSQQQQTNSKLSLPDTLSTGYYWIRAYTKSMAAKDSDYAAIVPLFVINPANPVYKQDHKKNLSANNQSVYLEMFPEGGNVVTGINSTIAFYLHDASGNPLSQTIIIKDNHDSIISTITTNNTGLSKTEFFPYYFRKYKAIVVFNGKAFTFPLPAFNRFAGQLSLMSDNGIVLKLRTILEDSINKGNEITYLLGISGDSLCFAGVGYGSYETEVVKAKFPKGIATFILFDKNFNYLSERSIYIKEDNVILKANLNRTTYSKRSNGVLSAAVLDKNNLPVDASLSISITDSNSLITNNYLSAAAILQNSMYGTFNNWNLMHLTSLSDADKDLMMLCRPPFYKNLKIENVINYKAAEDSIFYINGVVLDPKGQPLNNKVLNLLYLSENNSFYTDTTDNGGRFSFPVSRYMDSTQFAVQISNIKGRAEEAKVVIDNLPFPLFSTPTHLKGNLQLPAIEKTTYARFYADTTLIGNGKELLKTVRVNTKAKNYYDHTGRISSNTSVLNSEELLRLGMGNVGIGILRLPGVQLNNGYILINGPNDIKGINASSEPMVLLDGAQIEIPNLGVGAFSSPVMQYLNSLDPRELEFIEVLKGTEASIYGLRGSNGVISIHTSSDIKKETVSNDNKGTFKFYRQGIAKPNEYPQISYDQKKGKDFSFTDARSTLFWKGNVITLGSEPLRFNFTTNDIPGHYKIVITGITIHGDLIYQTLSFTNL